MKKKELLAARCQHREEALPLEKIQIFLKEVDGWKLECGFLTRSFLFDSFHKTMTFLNAVAFTVDFEDHHPEIRVSFGHCKLHFNTHAAGGITENDFICAAKINALYTHTFT